MFLLFDLGSDEKLGDFSNRDGLTTLMQELQILHNLDQTFRWLFFVYVPEISGKITRKVADGFKGYNGLGKQQTTSAGTWNKYGYTTPFIHTFDLLVL